MATAYDPTFERIQNSDGLTVRELAVRDLISRMSEREQLSVMSWLLNGIYVRQSDSFIDALAPAADAFETAYDQLSAIAEPSEAPVRGFWGRA